MKPETEKKLRELFDNHFNCYADTGEVGEDDKFVEGKIVLAIDQNQFISLIPQIQSILQAENAEYEPYMGWCDVEGCDNESCSNGSYYKEKGYWCLCSEHSKSAREGKPQYFMKQSAIDRENSRDKKTGCLPLPQSPKGV